MMGAMGHRRRLHALKDAVLNAVNKREAAEDEYKERVRFGSSRARHTVFSSRRVCGGRPFCTSRLQLVC